MGKRDQLNLIGALAAAVTWHSDHLEQQEGLGQAHVDEASLAGESPLERVGHHRKVQILHVGVPGGIGEGPVGAGAGFRLQTQGLRPWAGVRRALWARGVCGQWHFLKGGIDLPFLQIEIPIEIGIVNKSS